MNEHKAVAIVGLGAILPDAPDVPSFWKNIQSGRYSISDVPLERWDPNAYYSPDTSEPDKTYAKIGGWVRGFKFELLKWGIPIPPTTLALIDQSQQWAIAASRQALLDYGYKQRKFDPERTAVIFGNAMAGENHYATSLRVRAPQYMKALSEVPEFQSLPEALQQALLAGMQAGIRRQVPAVTEDTMPGELSNVIAGRVANIFNFSGPNFVTDAACASSFAALQAAIAGLVEKQFDYALTGGIDRNMGPESFVKFCKIGALSPDGSRPYSDGANGFVMGEGGAVFLLKRLEDAEREGDKIYAVVRGVGGSSDGKGKGITAPNPLGQQRAIERAWQDAGLSPATAGYFEGHGTSTKVGDVAEVQSLVSVLAPLGLKAGQIGLGSVKSNIGHLKSAAGAAGLLKTILSLHEQTLLPSVNFERPNPEIDFAHLPVRVETVAHDWQRPSEGVRRAGISSFGFGGTNFHVVIEEYLPGLLNSEKRSFPSVALNSQPVVPTVVVQPQPAVAVVSAISAVGAGKAPYRGLLFLGANSSVKLKQRLSAAIEQARQGHLPQRQLPVAAEVAAPERLAIDYETADDLIKRAEKALKGFENDTPNSWQALTAQGVYRGHGQPGMVVFMFPGQGSQYVNMLRDLRELDGVVADTFREADIVMRPILGRPLSELIFVDGDEAALAQAETTLRDTTITQPAVLTVSVALSRLLGSYGYQPDLVIGHSLGEYAALVAAGVLTFAEALQIVSARGRAMTEVASDDNGCMAAVSAPIEKVEATLAGVDGYVVIANINSPLQCVIGGSTVGIDAAIAAFQAAGFQAVKIPVSHAFHTKIVAPAGGQLRKVVAGMSINPPRLPVVANVTGELYPKTREEIIDMLAQQVASPVQFIKSMQTLYREGGRVLVEVGPKRVLTALATDNLKGHDDVAILSTNHPRKGGLTSLNEALCGLLAAGVLAKPAAPQPVQTAIPVATAGGAMALSNLPVRAPAVISKPSRPGFAPLSGSVVISGAGLGLPGRNQHVFDDENIRRILNGEQRIEALPDTVKQRMLTKRVTRLNKSEAGATLEIITDMERTIKLAGQRGEFNLAGEFGVPSERVDAYDIATQLAIGAGIEALRDAGIPLLMRYKVTSKGTFLPDRWMLPPALADETGVIFGSAFPGMDRMAQEAERFYEHQNLTSQIESLRSLQALVPSGQSDLQAEFAARIAEMEGKKAELNYNLDRRFIFRILSMGHSQFAEYIGARGPNTQINAACATTTQAVGIAEDWIRAGRCRRVIVIAGDDVTDGRLVDWVGNGLLASGATSTESDPRLAVLPFDRRRNGMIMGMGAAALVVESEDAVRERGVRAICEVLSSQIANSAFHGTRLDVQHVTDVMERVVSQAEERFGISRAAIAANTVFVSHETYTPARGGSAAAEIRALRQTFGELANQIVIANTKGYTGHTMGVGIEDVVAVKALENQQVPPIANIHNGFEPDPELGDLNLSKGGHYPVEFALRLGAGFGSQVAMTLLRRIPGEGQRIEPTRYNQWLAAVAGYEQAELETVQRTLRIKNQGAPNIAPLRSTWIMGQGPLAWAEAGQGGAPSAEPVQTETIPQPETAPHPNPLPRGEGAEQLPSPSGGRAGDEGKSLNPEAVTVQIVGLVSEKTGYPAEMLDLELDLEADLGIDTVKQAELFASVRGLYGIPRREDLRLSDYNTLAKVVGFVMEAKAVSQSEIVLAPAPTPPSAPQPSATSAIPKGEGASLNPEAVTAQVVALVSEKTGYPAEMLDLELDLEADLGIDTVKQAELFASVRGVYSIPRREDLRLSDYNTLAKVVGFVMEAKAVSQSETVLTPAPTPHPNPLPLGEGEEVELHPSPAGEVAGDEGEGEGVSPVLRRIPLPVLRPRLDLCKPTGVTFDNTRRVVVVVDRGHINDTLVRKLRGGKVKVLLLQEPTPEQAAEQAAIWLAEGPIHGVYFLPAADAEPELPDLDSLTWQSELTRRVRVLYALMRALPGNPFLVCATRMGGFHGYSSCGPTAPLGGSVSGFAKAYAREHPDSLVKVVDYPAETPDRSIAAQLVDETLRDPGAVEIGLVGEQRFAIGLIEQPLSSSAGRFTLESGSVFLVTGGAGGITVPVVTDLAGASHGSFYLTGRTALLDPSDPDLAMLKNDRPALKAEIAGRLKEAGQKATPAKIEQKVAALERADAVLAVLAAVQKAGGRVQYRVCDVTDPAAVSGLVKEIVQTEGHLDVIIHAAGVDQSHRLENKSREEFERVFTVKADGFYNLLKEIVALKQAPKAVVAFSSVAGRFGNFGQTDYSAANDLMCKLVGWLGAVHPEIKALALDWGAWAEVGMASRGNLPEVMRQSGIEMLPPETTAPLVRAELLAGQASGEVVLAGALGTLVENREHDGGLDLERANLALIEGEPIHEMLSRATGLDLVKGISLEAELDPQTEPFLKDHAMNGIPVLPGVMGIEGFSVAATHVISVLGSSKAGFQVTKMEDVRFLAPFKFYRSEPRRITWHAQVVEEPGGLVAHVSLESTLALRSRPNEILQHFSGRVYMRPLPLPESSALRVNPPPWNGAYTVDSETIYRLYFHGPAFQVLDGVQRSGDQVIGRLARNLPAMTSRDHAMLSAPVLIELCLQTAGIWEIGATGVLSLPSSIGRLDLYESHIDGAPIYAEVNPILAEGANRLSFDARVVDAEGRVYLELKNYRTSPLPYKMEDALVQPLRELIGKKD